MEKNCKYWKKNLDSFCCKYPLPVWLAGQISHVSTWDTCNPEECDCFTPLEDVVASETEKVSNYSYSKCSGCRAGEGPQCLDCKYVDGDSEDEDEDYDKFILRILNLNRY
jgi:hypothetical protein